MDIQEVIEGLDEMMNDEWIKQYMDSYRPVLDSAKELLKQYSDLRTQRRNTNEMA